MNWKHLAAVGSIFVLAASLGSGCATSTIPTFDADDDASGSGGEGANQGSGGMAGAGGIATGGTRMPSNCAIDCSTIETDQCHEGVCNEESGQCSIDAIDDGTACDDGAFCTIGESCQSGTCTAGSPNDCGIEVPACTAVICEESSKRCITAPALDDSPCKADNLCQVNTKCKNGLCIGATKDCFFAPTPNQCFVGECNPANGLCEPVPGKDGTTCDDPNDPCSEGKSCSNGSCVGGTPKDCSAYTVGCKYGICNPSDGQCIQQPVPPGGSCASAADDCNVGVCDMLGVCSAVPANESGTCEDGNQCTTGETCTKGTCGGGLAATQVIYFQDDFNSNSKVWTLEGEWAIGATSASSNCKQYGNEDPAMDSTPTGDNGVAGVVLGGCAQKNLHGYEYLTSPAVDLSVATGPVWASFKRWLNSDYTPFMQNIVEVYNGSGWVTIWESGSSPGVQDSSWSTQTYEVTQYKNANFKIRFGFSIGSAGVYFVGSWNVDDVIIANAICP
jgi:hypothetical protein